ncbi:chromate efflux transporter [Chachezhania sediminis]|uniref:chromate efflux transporter n=1 Tax=Chachezhania sediminis TaxID=2599291 RepID=UPI00131BFAFE|nr:chromate efflux transporter [Chachezhania sediminis]
MTPPPTGSRPPTLSDLVAVFGRIGLLSFGGPAAQIALMHRELVERRPWLDEQGFLRALSLCMLLPGPEAMQLATYAGWRLRGTPGGLIAGLLFVLPGAVVIAALAALYVQFGQVPLVQAAFVGVKATVIVVVLQALRRMAGRALTTPRAWWIAGLAFLGIFLFDLPFPAIIAAAAVWGYAGASASATAPPPLDMSHGRTVRTAAIWAALWLLPLVLLTTTGAGFLAQVGWFFAWLAVVTFGGAYAVLAYLTQTVVTDFHWISTVQMIDALGLAETTPGPLILVTQFVAMLAGQLQGGPGLALAAGAVALWATFVPCFLWIFVAGPYVEALAQRPRLSAALQGITAAVAGVILNLSVWFALHVLFAQVGQLDLGPLSLPWPAWSGLQPLALALTALAALAMLRLGRSLGETLAAGAVLGALAGWIFGVV